MSEKIQCSICGEISETVSFKNPMNGEVVDIESHSHKMGRRFHPKFYQQLMLLIQGHFDQEGEMK